jgi:putative intracellular protease/amidase
MESLDIAIALFPRFTALDAIGPYEVLSRLPGYTVTFVTETPGPVRSDTDRLCINVDASLEDLSAPSLILVPGGPGQDDQMTNERLLDWIRCAHEGTAWTTSVCTGSLLLGAAGLLGGKRATSYWLALEQLRTFGAEPVAERVVIDGKIITAAGVSSGIDMALTLASLLADDTVAQMLQLGIEYDPQPPFDAGAPDKAPADVVRTLRDASRFILS